jgi:hypothetical protein
VLEAVFSSDMRAGIGIRKLMVRVSIIPMGRKYLEVLMNRYIYPEIQEKYTAELLPNRLQTEKN